VPAQGVGDFADDHDLFQLADATDPRLLVGGREADGESISAERRLARIQKRDIVRYQGEQADKIAGVDCINPSRVHLTNSSFIRSHLQPPRPKQFDHATIRASVSIDRHLGRREHPECWFAHGRRRVAIHPCPGKATLVPRDPLPNSAPTDGFWPICAPRSFMGRYYVWVVSSLSSAATTASGASS